MKQQGHTNTELLDWLKQHGIIASPATLEHRLRKWGVRRKVATQIDDLAGRASELAVPLYRDATPSTDALTPMGHSLYR